MALANKNSPISREIKAFPQSCTLIGQQVYFHPQQQFIYEEVIGGR